MGSVNFCTRDRHNQRCTNGTLEKILLLPQVVLAQVETVIGHKYHDGVFLQTLVPECRQQTSHLCIHKSDGRVIGLRGFLFLQLGHFQLVWPVGQGSQRDVIPVIIPPLRQNNAVQRVQVKVLAGCNRGHMGPVKSCRQEKWVAGFVWVVLLQQADGLGSHLVICMFAILGR